MSPDALFERVARHFDELLVQWDGGDGFSVIREKWLAEASGLGVNEFM
ncbi:MAG: hypothetical protein R3D29_04635 [Nitratireductor sp.]